jgi:hypothetical protein
MDWPPRFTDPNAASCLMGRALGFTDQAHRSIIHQDSENTRRDTIRHAAFRTRRLVANRLTKG